MSRQTLFIYTPKFVREGNSSSLTKKLPPQNSNLQYYC